MLVIKTVLRLLWRVFIYASSSLHLQDHLQILIESCVQSSRLSDVIWRHWIWSGLVQQWFVTCYVPSNYINQCWIVINWSLRNKLYFNFINQVQIISFKGMHLKMLSAKCFFFCVLNDVRFTMPVSFQSKGMLFHNNTIIFAQPFGIK